MKVDLKDISLACHLVARRDVLKAALRADLWAGKMAWMKAASMVVRKASWKEELLVAS